MAASGWGKFSFGNPLPSLLKSYLFVVKHCCQCVGPVLLWWPSTKFVESYYFVVKHDCQWVGPVFLWWPSAKLVEIILLCCKTWLPVGGASFPHWWPSTKLVEIKYICCKTWLPVGGASFPLVTLYQAYWNHITLLWNMTASGWGQFSFGNPLPSLLKSYLFVVKHGCQ